MPADMLFINWVVPSQKTNRYGKTVDQFSVTAAHNRCVDARLEYLNDNYSPGAVVCGAAFCASALFASGRPMTHPAAAPTLPFPSEQYAYRPGRNAQRAVAEVDRQLFHGHPEVIDADPADYFGSIPATEPATPPAMAPLMHPLAWAAEENASPRTAAQMKSLLMSFSPNEAGGII